MIETILSLLLVFFVQTVICTETSPRHGGNDGIEHKIVCPYEGAITGINYRFSTTVDQIGFLCSSSMGDTTFGPFGRSDGKLGSILCAPNHYISSFYGKFGEKLNRLGIRCRYAGDVNSVGTVGGEFGAKNGTNFDELTVSIGARPISVTVWVKKNETVDGIQVTYGIPIGTKSKWDPSKYTEIEGPRHGYQGDLGNYHSIICPHQGVINGIEYHFSLKGIMSILFKCISSLGITIEGPFGSSGGTIQQLGCEDNEHIKYIFGNSDYSHLYNLGARCDSSGKDPGSTKEYARSLEKVDRKEITYFSDKKYSDYGKRPVKIEVWYENYVNAIQITYGNMPVALNCKITKIQVTERIEPNVVGLEVIGFSSGSTCSTLQQQLCLTVNEHRSNTLQKDSSTSNSVDKRSGIGFDLHGDFHYYYYIAADISRMWTKQESDVSSSSKQNSETKGLAKSVATTVYYQGPGAAFVIGYRTRYEIKESNVSVLYHHTCEAGSTPPIPDKVLVEKQSFGKVSFQDYQFRFEPIEKCTSEARECVASIKIDKIVFDRHEFESRLHNEFNNCLDN